MARPKRFELLTPRFVVWCSIQLSYGRTAGGGKIRGNSGIAIERRPAWQGLVRVQDMQNGQATPPLHRQPRRLFTGACIASRSESPRGHAATAMLRSLGGPYTAEVRLLPLLADVSRGMQRPLDFIPL